MLYSAYPLQRHAQPFLPTRANCTKSLRDSLGRPRLLSLRGCVGVPRWTGCGRLCVCLTFPLTCGIERGYALLVVGACPYNPHIAQTVPHNIAQTVPHTVL